MKKDKNIFESIKEIFKMIYRTRKCPFISIPLSKRFHYIVKRKQIRLKKLKAIFCRKCSYIMIQFDTCDIKLIKNNNTHRLEVICHFCGNKNRYFLGNIIPFS